MTLHHRRKNNDAEPIPPSQKFEAKGPELDAGAIVNINNV